MFFPSEVSEKDDEIAQRRHFVNNYSSVRTQFLFNGEKHH